MREYLHTMTGDAQSELVESNEETESTVDGDSDPTIQGDETGERDPGANSGDTGTGDDDAEPETIRVDRGVPRTSAVLATVGVLVGASLTAPFNVLAAPFALGGLVVVAGSLFLRESRGYFTLGVGFVLVATLVAGAYGSVPPELMIASVSALLVAWDVGQHGISVGQQLGRNTRTRRLELVHAGITILVTLSAGIVAVAVFQLSGGGRPAPAVAVVVVGSIVVLWSIRP